MATAPVDALPLSKDFTLTVDKKPVPVLAAKIAPGDKTRRWKAMDDVAHSADYFDLASFANFDMDAPVEITVTATKEITAAKILPSALDLTPTIAGNTLTFKLDRPRLLTVEINGDTISSLHLFASTPNPPLADRKSRPDRKVIYFGPGLHVTPGITVTDNQTLYLAPGAVLRGDSTGKSPVVTLAGNNITLCGRGIIDGSLSPTHSRNLLLVRGSNIDIEGLTLLDSPTWNLPIRQSQHVTVRNVKILGHRANSDGIDICNSTDVSIEDCFIRTLDDLIVVKTDAGQGEARDISVTNCVLYNQVAHALSVGAELREPVTNVTFDNCDIIHDLGREWTLRVFHCDSALVSNITFSNLRIEESPRLISLWIGKAIWTKDPDRGRIANITFRNITATTPTPKIDLTGFDTKHTIDRVTFENITLKKQPLKASDVTSNAFVRDISISVGPK